jgi:hypothetical protein
MMSKKSIELINRIISAKPHSDVWQIDSNKTDFKIPITPAPRQLLEPIVITPTQSYLILDLNTKTFNPKDSIDVYNIRATYTTSQKNFLNIIGTRYADGVMGAFKATTIDYRIKIDNTVVLVRDQSIVKSSTPQNEAVNNNQTSFKPDGMLALGDIITIGDYTYELQEDTQRKSMSGVVIVLCSKELADQKYMQNCGCNEVTEKQRVESGQIGAPYTGLKFARRRDDSWEFVGPFSRESTGKEAEVILNAAAAMYELELQEAATPEEKLKTKP